jgi:EmrB/QacA subfamily drug resistance transporter
VSSPSRAVEIEPHIWRIASVVIVGAIMSILDTTIVNVALDKLSFELHTTIASIQWVSTAYLLALGAVIPLTGWMARRIGTKPLFILSLVLFTGGSILCGFAWSTGSLVAFRVLQGLGGGMLMPTGQMILARAAGPQRMGRVMSVVGVPIVLAPVIGPALGGLIVDNLSWRWIFFVNIPIGVLAVVLALRLLPPVEREEAGPIDWVGFLMLGTGLPALTYGLAEIGNGGGITEPRVAVALFGGALLVALFARHALRARRPLLDVRLFSNRAFSAAAMTTFVLGMALFGAMILLPLYYQTVRGESAVVTGLLLAPQGLGVGLAMPLSGRLTDRIGGGIVSVFGLVLTILGTVPFVFVDDATTYWGISAALLVRGFGVGIAIMPAMSAAFAVLRPEQVTDASPQLNVLQRVGGSIGTAVFAVVLARGIRGAGLPTPHAMVGAYQATYWWVTGVTAVALIPAAVLAWIEHRARVEHRTLGADEAAELAAA